jgi:hypothetical protein
MPSGKQNSQTNTKDNSLRLGGAGEIGPDPLFYVG